MNRNIDFSNKAARTALARLGFKCGSGNHQYKYTHPTRRAQIITTKQRPFILVPGHKIRSVAFQEQLMKVLREVWLFTEEEITDAFR